MATCLSASLGSPDRLRVAGDDHGRPADGVWRLYSLRNVVAGARSLPWARRSTSSSSSWPAARTRSGSLPLPIIWPTPFNACTGRPAVGARTATHAPVAEALFFWKQDTTTILQRLTKWATLWHKWAAHSAGRHCLEPSPLGPVLWPCSGGAPAARSRLEQLEQPTTQRADLGLWPSARRCFPVADNDEQTGLQNLLGAWPGHVVEWAQSAVLGVSLALPSSPARIVVSCVCRRCHQYADHQCRHRSSRAMPPPSPHPFVLLTATTSSTHQRGACTCRLLETCNVSVSS